MDSSKHQLIKNIFAEALDLDSQKRNDFVRKSANGDEEVIREVMSLISHHQEETIMGQRIGPPPLPSATKTRSGKRFSPKFGDLSSIKPSVWLERLFGNKQRFGITLVVVFILLIFLSLWTHNQVKKSLEDIRSAEMRNIVDADVMAVKIWIEDYQNSVKAWSRTPEIQQEIRYLLQYGNCDSCIAKLQSAPWQDELTVIIEPYLRESQSAGYNVFDLEGYEIASTQRKVIGERMDLEGLAILRSVRQNDVDFMPPFNPVKIMEGGEDAIVYNKPIVWVGTRVMNKFNEHIGYFGVGRYADETFGQILNIARIGESGETFAFNDQGVMLSRSKYEDALRTSGLLPNDERVSSMLNLSFRDPGVNLMEGKQYSGAEVSHPFVTPIEQALASIENNPDSETHVFIKGYTDYRGVKVIGAYQWLPEFGFGILSQVDYSEAFAPLFFLDTTFGVLIAILALVISYSIYSSLRLMRLKRSVGEAAQLGQYTLIRKIGEGGIGQVYLAHHAMLKRPTAVKILKEDMISEDHIVRFEREVRLASRLTHPNTIEIYDFGRTPEGVFYYAMELLNGFTLSQIISMDKKMPFQRVIHILRQVAASVNEAHGVGLVHRDIKPQNIMLVQRGGEDDIIKVLDFGLVKEIEDIDSTLTRNIGITGTPVYMAPERIRDPNVSDFRSDLYAIGAVGYYLLAGEPVFEYTSDLDIIYQVINTDPKTLTKIDKKIPKGVANIIHQCLAKDPGDRPNTARELLDELIKLEEKHPWSLASAREWWKKYE